MSQLVFVFMLQFITSRGTHAITQNHSHRAQHQVKTNSNFSLAQRVALPTVHSHLTPRVCISLTKYLNANYLNNQSTK